MASTEKEKEYARNWYHANKDRLRGKRAEYTKKNMASIVEKVRKWRAKNPDKHRQWNKENWRKYYKKEVQAAWIANNIEHVRQREGFTRRIGSHNTSLCRGARYV